MDLRESSAKEERRNLYIEEAQAEVQLEEIQGLPDLP